MVVVVARDGAPAESLALGVDAAGRPLQSNSLLPVASITKLATALPILRLTAAGQLDLDAPIGRYLPDAAAAGDAVTVRATLCHTAGLADDLPAEAAPYRAGLDWSTLARACLHTPTVSPPGERVL